MTEATEDLYGLLSKLFRNFNKYFALFAAIFLTGTLFEKGGYMNLIKVFKVGTTRNGLTDHTKNDKEYFGKQYFADHCFVSKGIRAKSFEVPNIEISDHLPLILELDIQ